MRAPVCFQLRSELAREPRARDGSVVLVLAEEFSESLTLKVGAQAPRRILPTLFGLCRPERDACRGLVGVGAHRLGAILQPPLMAVLFVLMMTILNTGF